MQVYAVTFDMEVFKYDDNNEKGFIFDNVQGTYGYFSNFEKAINYLKAFYLLKDPGSNLPILPKDAVITNKHISTNISLKDACYGSADFTYIRTENQIKFKTILKLSVKEIKCFDDNNPFNDIFAILTD